MASSALATVLKLAGERRLLVVSGPCPGSPVTRTEAKHTHLEWLRFLKEIDRQQ